MMEQHNLITIEQNAIFTAHFEELGAEIEAKKKLAENMVVSEENYKDAKKIRADMNKQASADADSFKTIKTAILEPFNQVETAYIECVRNKYREADSILKSKIGEIETGLKDEKEQEIRAFFTEHQKANDLDFVAYEDLGINVRMSDSMKSLKENVLGQVESIKTGYDAILAMKDDDASVEILGAFKKNGYDLAKAISTVTERREYLAKQEEERKAAKERQEAERKHIEEVKAAEKEAAPTVTIHEEEEPKKMNDDFPTIVTFEVNTTIGKLRELVEFMRQSNIDFEQKK